MVRAGAPRRPSRVTDYDPLPTSMIYRSLFALALSALALGGCRGMTSEAPPIHPNLNMDFVQRFEAQEPNPFFADGSAMRQPVPGTVARGRLKTTENAPFYYGRTAAGGYVDQIPMEVTPSLVARGQNRFNIYCTPCHGQAGDGRGIVAVGNGGLGYGFQVPSYHTDVLRAQPDGYIYNVIQNGINTMPSYGHEIPPSDRWAIVSYIRALQRSQDASSADVPERERQTLSTDNPNVRQN